MSANYSPRKGTTHKVETACGPAFFVLNEAKEGNVVETFLKMGSQGTCESAFMAALGIVLSIALRAGCPMSAFTKALMATTCPKHNKVVTDYVFEDGEMYEVKKELPSCIAALGSLIHGLAADDEPYFELPESAESKSYHVPAGCGRLDVFVVKDGDKPVAVSANTAAPGSCANAISSTIARCITIALNTGLVDLEDFGKGLSGINCPRPTNKCRSCIDGIGRSLLAANKKGEA